MPQALIVDDSKTARVSLRKMLDKQQISSAMVECAEDALEYLQENRPTMIFMDHMMPGMDGFDAVKAIKADPDKASIPIVMYTTKQGDIYVGQARALGAADILPKPASEKALQDVLERVKKIIDDQSKKPDPVVDVVTSEPTEIFQQEIQNQPFFSLSLRQLMMLLVWIAPIIWLLVLYLPAEEQRKQLLLERKALYKSIEWVLNESEGYDYGEVPMSGRRLEVLKGLVSHLVESKFKGTIRMEGHIGEFCLSQVTLEKGGAIAMLPSAKLPLSQCATLGVSAQKAVQLSGQQSEQFKHYLETSPLLLSSDIDVEIVRYGASYAKYEYPEILESTTVGDWNTIALSNNRVNFVLVPKH